MSVWDGIFANISASAAEKAVGCSAGGSKLSMGTAPVKPGSYLPRQAGVRPVPSPSYYSRR